MFSGDWIGVSNILNVIFTDKNTFGEQGNHGPGSSHTSFKYVKLFCPKEILNIANVVSVFNVADRNMPRWANIDRQNIHSVAVFPLGPAGLFFPVYLWDPDWGP